MDGAMTNDEILATADACGLMLFGLGLDKDKFEFCILAFAKQISKLERHFEREACAKVCDDLPPPDGYNMTEISFWDVTSLECAEAIRARGQA
jgi:hypothetical protein